MVTVRMRSINIWKVLRLRFGIKQPLPKCYQLLLQESWSNSSLLKKWKYCSALGIQLHGGSSTETSLQRKAFTSKILNFHSPLGAILHPQKAATLRKSPCNWENLNPLEIYITCQTHLWDKSNPFGWKIACSSLPSLVF